MLPFVRRPLRTPRIELWGGAFAVVCCLALGFASRSVAAEAKPAVETAIQAVPVKATSAAVITFEELARLERLGVIKPPVRPLLRDQNEQEIDDESGEPGASAPGPESMITPPPYTPFAASPSPTLSFIGLDDIPMVDSSYIVIPPDVGGAVGLTKILQGMNNNYRILNKANGAVLSTVGTATFWSSVVPVSGRNTLTDPRTVYDPVNQRWIVCMISDFGNSNSSIELGVSQTSDPSGAWFLFRLGVFESVTVNSADFPILGFNKNWVTVTVNMYTSGGAFSRGKVLMAYYPDLRAGTFTAFTVTRGSGTGFCAAPCVTYSATTDTLYVPTHLGSAAATYELDRIVGSGPAAPTYVTGASQTRAGGGWVQAGGNQLPQSAPSSGLSACGVTPCPIEAQDAQIRSAPVYRGGFIYYTQSVGLPAGAMTHSGVQWTKLNTPSGTVADGGRIEDATATSTNGGKWYAFTHIAVNQNHDFMVGYSQFSSAQHPSTGYSVHQAGDGAGTIRDPVIYHAGEDYYHKTFSTTTGRNRWGDFTSAQVDPTDDMTLWTLQEYGKTRVGTDDGNTGSNSSRWSTWWGALAPPSVTIDAGPTAPEGNAGTTAFTFTVRLSYAYGLPVVVNYHTNDGSATVADNDYVSATSTVTIPAGSTTAPLVVNVNGDTNCEPTEAFSVTLTGANNNIPLGATVVSTGTITNDDANSITASAGPGGTITPSGVVPVACGGSQGFTIAPGTCFVIADVLVDGVSQGPVTTYTFTNVTAPHTIAASFASAMTLSQTHTNVNCNGGSNGAIDLTVNGGTPPYGYSWSNGATTEDITGLAAATYTVTVTDANSCVAVLAVPISQPPALVLSDTHVNVSTCGGATGSIDLTVAGGVPPYGYAWSNGPTTEDQSSLTAGSYTVTVTDANNCTAQRIVVITEPGAPTLSETHADVCTGGTNGAIDLTVTGGTPAFGYAWSNGATTEDITGLAAGPYSVTVTDANGCQAVLSATIGVTQYAIASTTGANGTISPLGSTPVPCGTDQLYTITPDPGYEVDQLLVDSSPITPVASYTFTNVTTTHTIDVTFKQIVTAVEAVPVRFALGAVVPNPTQASMQVPFGLPREAAARVTVVDLRGREIALLADGKFPAGWHLASWDGKTAQGGPAGAGLYFVLYRVAGEMQTKKFVLMR